MSKRDTPPFRADHVGSLLRPQRLLEARAASVRARRRYMTPTTTAGASCSGATSNVTWATSDKFRLSG